MFLIGRFGWRLWGFRACESAGIERVEVSEDCVEIAGFYPGSFPEGFLGYYAEEADGKLYVGFRFSAVLGFFETGTFSVSIPVRSEINQVVMKTSVGEYTLWKLEGGQIPGSAQYGIYIRLDCLDVGTVSVSYCGKTVEYDTLAWEQGEYVFFDCDLIQEAKNTEGPVPFVVTQKSRMVLRFPAGNSCLKQRWKRCTSGLQSPGKWRDGTMNHDQHISSRLLALA